MKKVIGRVIGVIPAVLLQGLWYLLILSWLGRFATALNIGLNVLAVIFVLYLISKREEPAYKILWIVVIVSMPVLGATLFLFLGDKHTGKKLKQKIVMSEKELGNVFGSGDGIIDIIDKEDKRMAQTLSHVSDVTGFPIVNVDTVKYYPLGEKCFEDMCEALRRAKSYIYVEYFIIEAGTFWNTLVDIMAEKAAEGVDVRVIYDDLGSIATFSSVDMVKLVSKGIKCVPFNPFFIIKTQLNNRDHRKIMVIDGKVAFSGGINLADEYINVTHKYGQWKDIAFRITGEGVKHYTYMFVEFWNAFSKDKIDAEVIRNSGKYCVAGDKNDRGYILPYYDAPTRSEAVSNVLFIELLSSATKYVWFYTPYLMLGESLYDAFIRAARRDVDVRIIMPGIPDKKTIYRISRSYYGALMEAGVKIYEYKPGFVHAKACIVDDRLAGIGTVNLDYRSLFLHYECYSLFYKADIIKDLKADFEETQGKCHECVMEEQKKGIVHAFINGALRVIAPLL